MASDQEINKRLRSLHQDFDFLLDNNIISAHLYDDLVAKIPRRCPATRQGSVASATTAPAAAPSAPASPRSSVSAITSQLNATSLVPAAATSPPPPPTPSSEPPSYGVAQAEVLYDYTSTDDGDLQIRTGQRITILEYVNNDWWRGESPTGQQGIFPSNYVKKIEAPEMKEKGYIAPAPSQYSYPGQQQQYQEPAQQYNQNPPYAQGQYQAPAQQQPEDPKQPSKLSQFGKNYGRTFVNATAWGGGMALGSDVINSIF